MSTTTDLFICPVCGESDVTCRRVTVLNRPVWSVELRRGEIVDINYGPEDLLDDSDLYQCSCGYETPDLEDFLPSGVEPGTANDDPGVDAE